MIIIALYSPVSTLSPSPPFIVLLKIVGYVAVKFASHFIFRAQKINTFGLYGFIYETAQQASYNSKPSL